jgi:selenide, water dikinase
VLIGGGHSHVAVLKAFGMRPLPGARVTLISRSSQTPYSGMLPGLVAGRYTADEAHIDLVPLCRFAGARFICAQARGIDPIAGTVALDARPPVAYDWLSINVGSTPALGFDAAEGAGPIPVKPIDRFLAQWQALLGRVAERRGTTRIGVVGGGAGGVELTLAAQHRLREIGAEASFALLSDAPELLITHDSRVRARFHRILAERGIAVHTQTRVVSVERGLVRASSGRELEFDEVLWVTDAAAAPWLAASGLAVDAQGFVLVDECLRSVSHPRIFAAGDAAAMRATPRPKSGVFAVRQGPPLARNLRRALLGRPLAAYRPQRRFLSLIGTGDGSAVASRGPWSAEGRWVWRWKDRIDRRFMRQYQSLPPMRIMEGRGAAGGLLHELPAELADDAMRCGGCGAKVGADVLRTALAGLEPDARADIVIGLQTRDDAAAVVVPEGKLAVLSVDAFRPMLDDPYVFGQITANHCLGDLFAMGAEAQTALALATLPVWPEAKLAAELRQMLAGAIDVLHAHGAALVGGHTSEGAELGLGFAVTGWIDREQLLRKTGLRGGDALILTKPIGTGVLLAANMRGRARGRWIDGAIEAMLQSNRAAGRILRGHGATACTDVTGFGLLGHLGEMIGTAALDVGLDLESLPVLAGAAEMLHAGIRSTLQPQNERAAAAVIGERLAAHPSLALLFDPQTAGGLLAGVPEARVPACLAELHGAGYRGSAAIGRVFARADGDRLRIDELP